MVSLVF